MTPTIDAIERARESCLRRKAASQGLKLIKSRSRTPECIDFGTYGIVENESNYLVHGGWYRSAYGASLDDVEQYLGGGR